MAHAGQMIHYWTIVKTVQRRSSVPPTHR